MRIKFCGMTRQEDVDAAVHLGAQYCGFIFHRSSPRSLTPDQAAALRTGPLLRVGVFVRQNAEEITRIMREARLDYAQLHGDQSNDCALAVGPRRVLRVLWPGRFPCRAALDSALDAYAPTCAGYVLDAGLSGGGSGRVLDWSFLSGLAAPHPWLLAGGLHADNVGRALALCAPDGVEFNSGVEAAPGRKDPRAMAAAVAALDVATGSR